MVLQEAKWLTTMLGRSKDGLYETQLADSEREAVADLLQYLENVSDRAGDKRCMPNRCVEGRNRLLFGRSASFPEHTGLFRQCGPATKR